MFGGFTRRQLLGGLLGLVGMALGRRVVGRTPPPAARTPAGGPVAYSYTTYEGGRVTTTVYDALGRERSCSVRPCAHFTDGGGGEASFVRPGPFGS